MRSLQVIHKTDRWVWQTEQRHWRIAMIVEVGRVKDAKVRARWVNSDGRNEQVGYLRRVKEMLWTDGRPLF